MAGGADLPTMVDTLPTFDEDYGADGQGEGTENGAAGSDGSGEGTEVAQGSGANAGTGSETGDNPGGANEGGGEQNSPGTRAAGGMESEMGADGPLTAAERVAILDRQLEESTRDFDGIIYDEEQRQREAARERAAAQQNEPSTGDGEADENEAPDFGGGMASAGAGSVGGGIGGRSGAPPPDGAKYPPPGDIPDGNDDDVVARQLREAAMREADPDVREKLWNEYRKYKGLEVPES
jgi:hypothetical protein